MKETVIIWVLCFFVGFGIITMSKNYNTSTTNTKTSKSNNQLTKNVTSDNHETTISEGKNLKEFLSDDDIRFPEDVKVISIKDKDITDISGIEKFTNLQILALEDCKISDISALKGLTKLYNLDLSGNRISDISALKGLTNLDFLDLKDNDIKDIRVLTKLTNLKGLDLNMNKVERDDIDLLHDALDKCKVTY